MSKMIDEAIEALIEKRVKAALKFYFDDLSEQAYRDREKIGYRVYEWISANRPERSR